MKLLSARQVWHDAYFVACKSTMDPTIAHNGSGYKDDTGTFLHRAMAGRFQSAICSLPLIHKNFGMMMYAPNDFICESHIVSSVDYIVLCVARSLLLKGRAIKHKQFEDLPYFVRAMLYRHRIMVANRADPFSQIIDLRHFLFDEFGVRLEPKDFTRTYGHIFETIKNHINEFDKQCLVPISKVIAQYKENRDEESIDRKETTAECWVQTTKDINKYSASLDRETNPVKWGHLLANLRAQFEKTEVDSLSRAQVIELQESILKQKTSPKFTGEIKNV